MSTKTYFEIDHTFGQDKINDSEKKTKWVILITTITMLAELISGIVFSSMALLADGIHMAAHVFALAISYFAYRYIRKNANNPRFSFGTGKVNALAGFTGAILLVLFALGMAWESIHRIIEPQNILFNYALAVAIIGLIINLICALILGHNHHHGHIHEHFHKHNHKHSNLEHHEHEHHEHEHHEHEHHEHEHHEHEHHEHEHKEHDTNYKAIYLHIITDALTSILAILALILAKHFNLIILDPIMGIVGAVVIIIWSKNLFKQTTAILLDHQSNEIAQKLTQELEAFPEIKICDLHAWSIGPGIYAGELVLIATNHTNPSDIKNTLEHIAELVHLTVEIHCEHCAQ